MADLAASNATYANMGASGAYIEHAILTIKGNCVSSVLTFFAFFLRPRFSPIGLDIGNCFSLLRTLGSYFEFSLPHCWA